MGVLPDWMIRKLGAITPYAEEQKRQETISFGETSYGYDLRCGYVFDIFTNVYGGVIDPKNFQPKMLARIDHSMHKWRSADTRTCQAENPAYVDIPPNSFALAETLEHITVPRQCLALVIGKSTYARCGLIVNVTPLEPEWRGRVTMELSNTAQLPSRVYAGEGIAQVLFLETAGASPAYFRALMDLLKDKDHKEVLEQLRAHAPACMKSYADKKGKYQDQAGLTNPKVD